MKKVIYSYIEPDLRTEIPHYLKKNFGWEPVIFTFNSTIKKGMEKFFPNAFIADEGELRGNIFNYNGFKKKIIDTEIIKKLKPFENNCLSMIREAYPGAVSFNDRRNYYYGLLNYWNTIINEKKPDIYISYTCPHNETTYTLYLMCKYIFSIPVVFMEDYSFLDKYYTFNNNVENQSSIFKNYEKKEIKDISSIVKNYFNNFKSKPSSPSYLKDFFSFLDDKEKIVNKSINFLREIVRVVLSFFKSNKFMLNNSFYKMYREQNIMSLTRVDYFYYEKVFQIKNFLNKNFYEKISEKKIPDKNFVFFAPSQQPEYYGNLRTGIFEDHILVLELLKSNLPDNWAIVYKEHPFQFAEKYSSISKDKIFYKKIKKMKNVHILSQSINTYDVISKSSAIACTGSTVGVDAMMMGKPCIVFGNCWFNSCKSSINVKTNRDLEEAFKKIRDGYKPSEIDLMSFMDHIYNLSSHVVPLFIFKHFKNKFINKNFDSKKDLKQELQKVALNFHNNFVRLYEK